MPELIARVRALLRRASPERVADVLVHGEIELDREKKRVSRAGRTIDLGPTEYRLLEFLMERPGRVFSRTQLLDAVWGSEVYIDERTVDVHVGRLRKALNRGREADPIRTVRGAGYVFAFAMLSVVLAEGVAIGVAYGIWAAAGVAITAILSRIFFKEPLTWVMILGLILIVGGVLLIELGAAH